jgi:hypothetical protein
LSASTAAALQSSGGRGVSCGMLPPVGFTQRSLEREGSMMRESEGVAVLINPHATKPV